MIKEPNKILITNHYVNEVKNLDEIHIPNDNYICVLINVINHDKRYVLYFPTLVNDINKYEKLIEGYVMKFYFQYIFEEYKSAEDIEYSVLTKNENMIKSIKIISKHLSKLADNTIDDDTFNIEKKDNNIIIVQFNENDNTKTM